MKKIYHIINLMILLLLITSCSSNHESVSTDKIILETTLEQIPANSEFVLFNDQKLYYFIDEIDVNTPDLANKSLYEYDLNKGKTTEIKTFNNISISSGSKAIDRNNIFLHLATGEQNNLIKVDTNKLNVEVIKKWETFPPLAYIYKLNDYLILFGPDSTESAVEYYINKIDLTDNNKEENIVNKKIENKKGELIACIDVDKEFIYAFSILSLGSDETYRIIQYDLNGNQCNIYPFDLNLYLSKKTLASEDDAIIGLYKENDHIILNTINGRIFMYKIIDDMLKPINIPDKFYKNNPAGYRFLQYYDGNSSHAYFINSFDQNNIIEAYNYSTEAFTTISLPEDIENIYSYYRNANGDLIIKKRNNKDISQAQYYYIQSPFERK